MDGWLVGNVSIGNVNCGFSEAFQFHNIATTRSQPMAVIEESCVSGLSLLVGSFCFRFSLFCELFFLNMIVLYYE